MHSTITLHIHNQLPIMATSTQSTDTKPKRPRGILKNPSHHGGSPPAMSPTAVEMPPLERGVSEKELTLANTQRNAGPRRTSSSQPGSVPRRPSSAAAHQIARDADGRLKWDEANLYLNENERTATMKIDEPKTPFVHADPSMDVDEEEESDVAIDPSNLKVDELDSGSMKPTKTRESDIPGLDIGQPEEEVPQNASSEMQRTNSGREKSVSLTDPTPTDDDGPHTKEEIQKHKKFEEARKRHYEMRDVKGLLGYVHFSTVCAVSMLM